MNRAGTDPQPSPAGEAPGDRAGAGIRSRRPASAADADQDGVPAPGGVDGADAESDPAGPAGAAGAGAARPPWPGWDQVLRVAGVVIAILASLLSGLLEVMLSTMRAGDLLGVWTGDAIGSGGGPLIGLSVLLAAVFNVGIAHFALVTTRRRWAVGPPWALWTLLMLFAAGVRTTEGDYLLSGDNWVALIMILVGSLGYAVYSYRMILGRVPR